MFEPISSDFKLILKGSSFLGLRSISIINLPSFSTKVFKLFTKNNTLRTMQYLLWKPLVIAIMPPRIVPDLRAKMACPFSVGCHYVFKKSMLKHGVFSIDIACVVVAISVF